MSAPAPRVPDTPPLAEPSPDYGELAGAFPQVTKDRMPEVVFRVHRLDREPEWFTEGVGSRWDPPPASGATFGTCYVATHPLTALMEVVGDLPVLTSEQVDDRAMATLMFPDVDRLADMTSPEIARWGLDPRISMGDFYDVSQRWALAPRLAGYAGVYCEPRHDPGGGASVALFGDPGYQPTQVRLVSDGPIDRDLIDELFFRFGVRVMPARPLLS
ncbi:MAG: RES family NAD+ phosphorylase [Acidimicrobiales bacterium]